MVNFLCIACPLATFEMTCHLLKASKFKAFNILIIIYFTREVTTASEEENFYQFVFLLIRNVFYGNFCLNSTVFVGSLI